VDEAIEKLEKLGIPWRRPNDYFAEMIKYLEIFPSQTNK
jgi:hypothetical protein